VLVGVLVVAAGEGVSVVQNAKIDAGFRPDVIGLGGMDVRVVAAGGGQDVGVGRGKSGLFTDIDDGALITAVAVPFTRLLTKGALGFW